MQYGTFNREKINYSIVLGCADFSCKNLDYQLHLVAYNKVLRRQV
jgi:hypothetical protein